MNAGVDDLARGTLGVHGDQRKRVTDAEPGVFLFVLTFEVGIAWAAGAHQSGDDGSHADTVFRHLGVESFRKPHQCELAGVVGKQMRHADLPAYGGDVHDAPRAAITHRGKDSESGVQRAPVVGVHCIAIILLGHYFHGTDFDDACIVDQNVYGSELALYARDHLRDGVLIGDVAYVGVHDSAFAAEFLLGAAQRFFVAAADCDSRTFSRELTSELQPQAARAAGDDHKFAAKVDSAAGADGTA